jgi:hypothetical protein
MSHTIDLKELERKAYRSFFEDGIWDIYLGLLLLAMGGGPALLALGAPVVWAAIAPLTVVVLGMLVFFGGKKYLTVPRLGAVQFGPARTQRRKKTSVVLACSVVVGIALLALSATRSLPSLGLAGVPTVAIIFAANCVIVFSLGAYYLDFSRLYICGLLYAVPFPLAVVLAERWSPAAGFLVAYALSAGPMILVGLILLVRFLREYPVAAQPEPYRKA